MDAGMEVTRPCPPDFCFVSTGFLPAAIRKFIRGGEMKITFGLYAFVFFLGLARPTHGGSLDSGILKMFPRNIAEFGYANLEQANQFPWFAQLKLQSLPPRFEELEVFLGSLGMGPTSQIKEVVWALCSRDSQSENGGKSPRSETSENGIVGLVFGQFDTNAAEATLKSLNAQTVEIGDSTLFRCINCDDLIIVFLDSNTIAFGQGKSLELMMGARSGETDNLQQNSEMIPLINQMNDGSMFWGVLAPAGARQALHKLAPDAAQFPQADEFFTNVNGLAIRIRGLEEVRDSDEIEADVQFLSRSPGDSSNLSLLLNAALLLRKYRASQTGDDAAKFLETVRIAPLGNSLDISFSITNDQLMSLVEHNIFVSQTQ
jgi:hypothetical protein